MTDEPATRERAGRTDTELSRAVVAYCSADRSSFPWPAPDAVRALATTWSPEELLDAVRAVESEIFQIPVDWSTTSLRDAGRHTEAVMAQRHPELSPEAVAALRWNFTCASR